MRNITLSLDEDVLRAGREYARAHNISFNVLVRREIVHTDLDLIEQAIDISAVSRVSYWDALLLPE